MAVTKSSATTMATTPSTARRPRIGIFMSSRRLDDGRSEEHFSKSHNCAQHIQSSIAFFDVEVDINLRTSASLALFFRDRPVERMIDIQRV